MVVVVPVVVDGVVVVVVVDVEVDVDVDVVVGAVTVTVTVVPGSVTVTVRVLGQAPSRSPRRRCARTERLVTLIVCSRFAAVRWHIFTFGAARRPRPAGFATATEASTPAARTAR